MSIIKESKGGNMERTPRNTRENQPNFKGQVLHDPAFPRRDRKRDGFDVLK